MRSLKKRGPHVLDDLMTSYFSLQFATPPKTSIVIISGTGKAIRTSNFAGTFTGYIRTQAHEKFCRKGSLGVSRDCPNFLDTPYYLRNG